MKGRMKGKMKGCLKALGFIMIIEEFTAKYCMGYIAKRRRRGGSEGGVEGKGEGEGQAKGLSSKN